MLREETEEGVGVRLGDRMLGQRSRSQRTCVEAVRNQGTVAQVGLHVKRASVDPALWALKDITIEATWCYGSDDVAADHRHGRAGRLSGAQGDNGAR